MSGKHERRRGHGPAAREPRPFLLREAHVELQQLLKAVGACGTGGEAKHVVQGGEVRVNGAVERRRSRKLVAGDLVQYRGDAWRVAAASA